MLDLSDLSLEGVERLCQADMTWKLVPLYYCPGKERESCIVFVCSQLAVLMFSSSSTSFQTGLFINGNKVMSNLKEHGETSHTQRYFSSFHYQCNNWHINVIIDLIIRRVASLRSTKHQTSSPTGWLRMRIWRMSLRRTKSAIFSWAGSNAFAGGGVGDTGFSCCRSRRGRLKLFCVVSTENGSIEQ